MKMNTDRKWLEEKALQEDGCDVSVGGCLAEVNWVIYHKKTRQYYKGSAGRPRWSKTLQGAKKYRRRGDAGNALSLALALHYFDRDEVVVERYKLVYDGEEPA